MVIIKGSLLMSLPIIKCFLRNAHAPWHMTQGRGSQITTYLDPRLHIAYSLCNFHGAAVIIKNSFLMSLPIIKQSRGGATNNHIFGIPDPILPIHFATFRGLRFLIIKGRLLMSLPIVKRFGAMRTRRVT